VVFVWAMGNLVVAQVPFGPSRLTLFFDRVRNSCVRKDNEVVVSTFVVVVDAAKHVTITFPQV